MLQVKELTILAVLTAILFVQEQLLSFLPNISFTVFLMVLYAKRLGFWKSSCIIIIHTTLDNLVLGSFNLMFYPAMLIGWLLIPILLHTFFKRVNNPMGLALLGILFSLLYSWIFIIPNILFLEIDFWTYLVADIPFEIILAGSSFISILWLYEPLSKVLNKLLNDSSEV